MFTKLNINKSSFLKVILINILMALCVIIFLLLNNIYIKNQLINKIHQSALSQLSIIRSNINTEVLRLKNINYKISYNILKESLDDIQYNTPDYYVKFDRVQNIIEQFKASISYNANYYIVYKTNNLVISDAGSYMTNIFYSTIKSKYPDFPLDEKGLLALPEGLNVFNDFILYISESNKNIKIFIEIRKDLFSTYNMQKFGNSEYSYIAFYNDKDVITQSLSLPLSASTINKCISEGKDEFANNSERFNMVISKNSTYGLNMTLVCIYPEMVVESEYQVSSNYTIWSIIFFIIANLLMILFQFKIYNPIRKLVSKISALNEKFIGNDATVIYNAFENLRDDNENLKLLVSQAGGIYKVQALLSLMMSENRDIDSDIIDSLNRNFKFYIIIMAMFDTPSDNIKVFEKLLGDEYFFLNPLTNERYRVYVVACEDLENLGANINKIIVYFGAQNKVICGLSQVFSGIENACNAYIQSIHAIYESSVGYMLANNVCFFSGTENRLNYIIPTEDEKWLISSVLSGKEDEVGRFFDVLLGRLNDVSYKNFKRLYTHLLNIAGNILNLRNIKDEDVGTSTFDIESVANIANIHSFVKQLFVNITSLCQMTNGDLFDKIISYIGKNINKDLSVNTIAYTFEITPEYLSTYFKKKSGTNLSSYINSARIQVAINILNDKRHIKVAELAKSVGFENVPTFLRQFKLYTGTTPTLYKESIPESKSD